jgi:hypothetical protein
MQALMLQEFISTAKACLADEAAGKDKQAHVREVLSRVADYMRRSRVSGWGSEHQGHSILGRGYTSNAPWVTQPYSMHA